MFDEGRVVPVYRWKRSAVSVLGGALLLFAGVPLVSSVLAGGGDGAAALSLDDDQGQPPASHPSGSPATGDQADGDDAGRHGPPPWAHGHATKGQDKSLTKWKAMTPARREATMTRLAREHAAGMKVFSACVAAGRHDCVKPLPPGLAKRG
jgi:hypothetical protein